VSLLIIKIVVMCRNIQRQGYVVFGEFFQEYTNKIGSGLRK
jgi:hypothetical protein